MKNLLAFIFGLASPSVVKFVSNAIGLNLPEWLQLTAGIVLALAATITMLIISEKLEHE